MGSKKKKSEKKSPEDKVSRRLRSAGKAESDTEALPSKRRKEGEEAIEAEGSKRRRKDNDGKSKSKNTHQRRYERLNRWKQRREKNGGKDSATVEVPILEEPDHTDNVGAEDVHVRDKDEIGVDDDNGDGRIEEEDCRDLTPYFGADAENDDGDVDPDSGEDGWDDERIPDPLSSDEENEAESRPGLTYREGVETKDLLWLGKTFSSADEFKHALLRYTLKMRYNIMLYRSSSLKLGAKCAAGTCKKSKKAVAEEDPFEASKSGTDKDEATPCPWSIYCSYERRKQKLMVKVYVNKHTCEPTGYSKILKPTTIAMLYAERLRLDPTITRYQMQAEIQREYGMIVTDEACGKAKTRVMNARKGSHEEQFDRVWDYQAEILRSNPGSTMEIETIPGPEIGSKQRFYRMYVCFHAQKHSWKTTCRPIFGVDGAFLKWDIKGQLLAAVGRDGDNRIVPIAWAVVEIENETNWEWFLKHLAADLDLRDGKGYTILSDKQKGLVKAIHGLFPESEHRQCCRHIYDNWKKGSKDMELQRLFWKIARSHTEGEFRENMSALEKHNAGAHGNLLLTRPETWSRAYFKIGSFSDEILNNLCESFNRTIKAARRKPLLEMLEDIRRQCMVRNAKRSIIAMKWQSTFTKKAQAQIKKVERKSKECSIFLAVGSATEVSHKGVSYSVNMGNRECGCLSWQMTGIPCIHAACVITSMKQQVGDYVAPCYSTLRWRQTYSVGISPVQGKILWPVTNRLGVLPPPWRKGNPGRPKNHDRFKSVNEKADALEKTKLSRHKRIMTCSNCKQEGHNKSTCQNANVPDQPKKPRGRPKKHKEAQTEVSQHPQSQPQTSQQHSSHPDSSQGGGSGQWEHAARVTSRRMVTLVPLKVCSNVASQTQLSNF